MMIYCDYPEVNNDKKVVVVWAYGGSVDFNTRKPEFEEVKGALADNGITVVSFDYASWNGKRHDFSKQSIFDRYLEAEKLSNDVLERFSEYKVVLVGNSMGGAIMAEIARSSPVDGVVLIAPALYHQDAWWLKMSDDEFTKILKTKDSWKESTEPDSLGEFAGPKLLISSSADEVVTEEMTDMYRKAGDITLEVVLGGPGEYKIFPHQEKRDEVVRVITSFVDTFVIKGGWVAMKTETERVMDIVNNFLFNSAKMEYHGDIENLLFVFEDVSFSCFDIDRTCGLLMYEGRIVGFVAKGVSREEREVLFGRFEENARHIFSYFCCEKENFLSGIEVGISSVANEKSIS